MIPIKADSDRFEDDGQGTEEQSSETGGHTDGAASDQHCLADRQP